MRTFALCASLAAVTLADQADFPKDDAMHADCHVTAAYKDVTCDELYESVFSEVKGWNTAETSPSGGIY